MHIPSRQEVQQLLSAQCDSIRDKWNGFRTISRQDVQQSFFDNLDYIRSQWNGLNIQYLSDCRDSCRNRLNQYLTPRQQAIVAVSCTAFTVIGAFWYHYVRSCKPDDFKTPKKALPSTHITASPVLNTQDPNSESPSLSHPVGTQISLNGIHSDGSDTDSDFDHIPLEAFTGGNISILNNEDGSSHLAAQETHFPIKSFTFARILRDEIYTPELYSPHQAPPNSEAGSQLETKEDDESSDVRFASAVEDPIQSPRTSINFQEQKDLNDRNFGDSGSEEHFPTRPMSAEGYLEGTSSRYQETPQHQIPQRIIIEEMPNSPSPFPMTSMQLPFEDIELPRYRTPIQVKRTIKFGYIEIEETFDKNGRVVDGPATFSTGTNTIHFNREGGQITGNIICINSKGKKSVGLATPKQSGVDFVHMNPEKPNTTARMKLLGDVATSTFASPEMRRVEKGISKRNSINGDGSPFMPKPTEPAFLEPPAFVEKRGAKILVNKPRYGELNGEGVGRTPNGSTLTGVFFSGEFCKGKVEFTDGTVMIGDFNEGKPHGEVQIVFPDQGVFFAAYNNGAFVNGTMIEYAKRKRMNIKPGKVPETISIYENETIPAKILNK